MIAEQYADTPTVMSRGLRTVRTGYAYQPPAFCTYQRRRAACPPGPHALTYAVRVPAVALLCVPRTVAPQASCRGDNQRTVAPGLL